MTDVAHQPRSHTDHAGLGPGASGLGSTPLSRRRRFIIWTLRLKSRGLALAALLGFGLWLTGRIMSDRTVWSQWLSWIPTAATAAGMFVCVVLSSLNARLARRLARGHAPTSATSSTPNSVGADAGGADPERPAPLSRPRLASRRTRLAALVLILLPLVYIVHWEWRLPQGLATPAPASGKIFTLLYWNHAGNWANDWMDTTSKHLADITVLNSPRYWEYMPRLMEQLEKEHGRRPHYQRVDSYAVLSTWPIVRWAKADLQLPTLQTKLRPYATVYERGWYWNRGGASWIEFDTKDALGKNLIVWIVDMPSDPRLHREDLARIAGEKIRAWDGVPMIRGPVGQFLSAKEKMHGFPDPDLIFGDFNIPRGAQSLHHIVGDALGAFEQVGKFNGATYPRALPLLGIDQLFTDSPARALTYAVFDPGFGMHDAQEATIAIELGGK